MVTLHGTKQKEETLGLIAREWLDASVGDKIEIIQPNDMGGKSLEKMLKKHFPDVQSDSHSKARYITLLKTEDNPEIIDEWIKHTELRFVDSIGFYSMPGLFGWNKIDIGSRLLTENLPELKGFGADFGCGYGYLSRFVLSKNKKVNLLNCIDYDLRSVEACKKNVSDDRAMIDHGDCTKPLPNLPPLDFIVMNPPFHEGYQEDREMGQRFIETAYHHLKKGGVLWMVANKHLPYEHILTKHFKSNTRIAEQQGFKVVKALK